MALLVVLLLLVRRTFEILRRLLNIQRKQDEEQDLRGGEGRSEGDNSGRLGNPIEVMSVTDRGNEDEEHHRDVRGAPCGIAHDEPQFHEEEGNGDRGEDLESYLHPHADEHPASEVIDNEVDLWRHFQAGERNDLHIRRQSLIDVVVLVLENPRQPLVGLIEGKTSSSFTRQWRSYP